MKILIICLFVLLFNGCYSTEELGDSEPQQIHLSFGNNPLEIIVTWTTYDESDKAMVHYSKFIDKYYQVAVGETTKFVDGGELRRVHYIHRVNLTGLDERTFYKYRCGCDAAWSIEYSFRTFTMNPDASSELLIYGDLGLENGRSIPRIFDEILNNDINAILHVGDFAYNLDTNESRVGDEFMRKIEPIAAQVPYQVCAGNHEASYNFSNYNNRFSMINMWGVEAGEYNNWFYSFYMGPALFIGFSTEAYFFLGELSIERMQTQYNWLEKTLKLANKPENRERWPWIITFAHRPMYCSNNNSDECIDSQTFFREGYGTNREYGLEKLFYEHGVDIELWAHEHSYERLFPLFNMSVYNGTKDAYTNPRAPVHIITGAAGCDENIDGFIPKPKEWSALRISDYGYTRMNIINRTHINFKQISDEKFGKIVDEFTVIKHYHGSYYDIPEEYL